MTVRVERLCYHMLTPDGSPELPFWYDLRNKGKDSLYYAPSYFVASLATTRVPK